MGADHFEKRSGNRRNFFRALLGRAVDPIANAMERPLEQFENVTKPMPQQPTSWPRVLLRPPGARPESEFLSSCVRTGKCAEVCPVQAIKFLRVDDPLQNGTPYIEPELQACVVCQDVPCAANCPTAALLPVTPSEIRIGLAEWQMDSCLRPMGQDCRECVEKCPVGATAIEIDDAGNVVVKADSCTGCGVCQMYCPTFPKSISVRAL